MQHKTRLVPWAFSLIVLLIAGIAAFAGNSQPTRASAIENKASCQLVKTKGDTQLALSSQIPADVKTLLSGFSLQCQAAKTPARKPKKLPKPGVSPKTKPGAGASPIGTPPSQPGQIGTPPSQPGSVPAQVPPSQPQSPSQVPSSQPGSVPAQVLPSQPQSPSQVPPSQPDSLPGTVTTSSGATVSSPSVSCVPTQTGTQVCDIAIPPDLMPPALQNVTLPSGTSIVCQVQGSQITCKTPVPADLIPPALANQVPPSITFVCTIQANSGQLMCNVPFSSGLAGALPLSLLIANNSHLILNGPSCQLVKGTAGNTQLVLKNDKRLERLLQAQYSLQCTGD